jgi:hypothetical protein
LLVRDEWSALRLLGTGFLAGESRTGGEQVASFLAAGRGV